jgi:hypothetical protein
MLRRSLVFLAEGLAIVAWVGTSARAVENGVTNSLETTPPTNADISNWETGWSQPAGQFGVTGWNYVGMVAGGGGSASGVYLGNNWVVTAGHVGAATFTLAGNAYSIVPSSSRAITDANCTADITLFQIVTAPNLPSLSIATSAPQSLSASQNGSQVAMIGFGDGGSRTTEAWGVNTVTQANEPYSVGGFHSTDFESDFGTITAGANSATNDYYLVIGDSGGGDFVFNSSLGEWQLAGIGEDVNTNNDSFMVQFSPYASQINSIVAAPEPSVAAFATSGLVVLLAGVRRSRLYRPRK